MRIVVMGAGGIGGYYGFRLQQGGHDVVFVARGKHLDAIEERQALTIRTEKGEETLCPIFPLHNPAHAVRADLVLLTTKAFDLPAAIEAIRPLVGPSCPVMTLQNGVDAPYDLASAFGSRQVIAGTVAIGCHIAEPGVVVGPSTPAKIVMGEMDNRAGDQRMAGIQKAFKQANVELVLRSDFPTFVWKKLLLVGPRSVITVLGRTSLPFFREAPGVLELLEDLLREYLTVGRAEGAHLPETLIGELMEPAYKRQATVAPMLVPGQMPSLLRDAENRRPMEVEAMIGCVVRRARVRGIEVPTASVLYTLLLLQDATNRARLEEKT